jgi:NADH-quinone oxidoreductase subunit D
MLGVGVPERAQLIRVLMSELSRVSDHLTCIAAMAMENGAFTVFLYMMKAREFLWDVIEFTTGSRMTTSYIRIGGVRADLAGEWREMVKKGVLETRRVLKDVHGLLDGNQIFINRTRGIAVISKEDALSYGWTGPCLRSAGVLYDVRKAHPYLLYDRLQFDVPLGDFGDNFDRYMVRMREMEQSLRLLEQVASLIPDAAPLPAGPSIEPAEAIRRSRGQRTRERIRLSPNLEGYEKERLAGLTATSAGGNVAVPAKEDTYTTMEGLISHFLFFMSGKGIRPPKGDVYFSVEGGNGEVGFYIVSDGTDKPYRLHLRAPCFHVVAALEQLIKGRLIADVIPTFGSMNMIGGELDR